MAPCFSDLPFYITIWKQLRIDCLYQKYLLFLSFIFIQSKHIFLQTYIFLKINHSNTSLTSNDALT